MQHLFDDPFLSEEDVQRILQLEPKCPHCGEPGKFVLLYSEAKHELWREVDGSPSTTISDSSRLLLNVHSDPYDREVYHPTGIDYPMIECENAHKWSETRVRFKDWRLELR